MKSDVPANPDYGDIRDQPEGEKHFWTAGNDPDVTHVKLIDYGATGEVHKVFSITSNSPNCRGRCMIGLLDRYTHPYSYNSCRIHR